MYNLLEYSDNYSMTSRSLWNYYRDEVDNVNNNTSDGKLFTYKTKITRKTKVRTAQPGNEGDGDRPAQPPLPTLNVAFTIQLKYLGNFWRSLHLPLSNYEVELDLYTKDCVLVEHNNNITGIDFKITSTKIYIPVATLSINDKIKFLENLKLGFKRTVSWNKYTSEITTQPKNNNLDYMINPINRLFVLSFELFYTVI